MPGAQSLEPSPDTSKVSLSRRRGWHWSWVWDTGTLRWDAGVPGGILATGPVTLHIISKILKAITKDGDHLPSCHEYKTPESLRGRQGSSISQVRVTRRATRPHSLWGCCCGTVCCPHQGSSVQAPGQFLIKYPVALPTRCLISPFRGQTHLSLVVLG